MHAAPVSTSLLAKECGLTWKSVAVILNNLTGQQITHAYGSNRSQLFQFNAQHPLAKSLQELFRFESEHWSNFLGELRRIFKEDTEVEAAWYYGSAARGEDAPQSDFDISLIVNEGSKVDSVTAFMQEALRPVGERFFVAFSVVGLSRADVRRLYNGEESWWTNMARDAKILKGKSPQDYVAVVTN